MDESSRTSNWQVIGLVLIWSAILGLFFLSRHPSLIATAFAVGIMLSVACVIGQELVTWIKTWRAPEVAWFVVLVGSWAAALIFQKLEWFAVALAITFVYAWLSGIHKPACLLAASAERGLAVAVSYIVLFALSWFVTAGIYLVLWQVLPPTLPYQRFLGLSNELANEDWHKRRTDIKSQVFAKSRPSGHEMLEKIFGLIDSAEPEKAQEAIAELVEYVGDDTDGRAAVALVKQWRQLSDSTIKLEYDTTDNADILEAYLQSDSPPGLALSTAALSVPSSSCAAVIKHYKDKTSEPTELFRIHFFYTSSQTAEALGCLVTIKVPDITPKERTLPPMVFFQMHKSGGFTPYTYVVLTPASTHVFDRAIQNVLDIINEEEKDAFATIGYQRSEGDEILLRNQLTRILKEALGGAQPEDKAQPTLPPLTSALYFNRMLNGPIQWATVMVFIALIIHAGARWMVYCRLEASIRRRMSYARDMSVQLEKESENLTRRASWGAWNITSPFLEIHKTAGHAYDKSHDYMAVPQFIDSEAGRLLDERTARHALMKYLLWAIPTIGFVGTVVGIGAALLETVNVDSISIVERSIAKSNVSSNIGVAFDTTLVALVLSLIGMLLYLLLVQFEELAVVQASASVSNHFLREKTHVADSELQRLMVEATKDLMNQIATWRESTDKIDALSSHIEEQALPIILAQEDMRRLLVEFENTTTKLRKAMIFYACAFLAIVATFIVLFWEQLVKSFMNLQ